MMTSPLTVRNSVALLLAAWASPPVSGQCTPPTIDRLLSPGGSGDRFGRWVDIDGDFAVIAGDSTGGADLAYVYKRNDGGTPFLLTDDVWSRVARLNSASGPATGAAIHGDTVAISTSSALLVFSKPGPEWQDRPTQTARLTKDGLLFRQDVEVFGDVIVGAGDLGSGKVLVYVKPSSGGWTDAMSASAELEGSGGTLQTYIGMDGDTIAIQAVEGAIEVVYVYVEPSGGWSGTLTQRARLQSPSPAHVFFGAGIAVSGDNILVASVGGGPACIFRKPSGPEGWTGTVPVSAQLTPLQGLASLSRFGERPALEGDKALLGSDNNKAFYFKRTGQEWVSMTETDVLLPDRSPGDKFGYRNALSQGTALIGAFNDEGLGSAYLFALNTCDLIVQHPTSLARCEGEQAVFSVVASGTGTLGYQWKKDGVPLTDGGTLSGATTATLTISATAPGDSGAYHVIVTDGASVQQSEAALLVVSALPTFSGPTDQQVNPGETAEFTVVVSAPASTFSFEWRDPDDLPLASGGNVLIESTSTSSTLTLITAMPPDDGLYTVIVTDSVSGCSASATASLSTDDLEILIPLPPVLNACDGAAEAVLEVVASASGPMGIVFEWFKDDTEITASAHLEIDTTATSSRLTIHDVVPSDQGLYRVDVKHLGTLSSQSQLVLVPAPSILQQPVHSGFCPGDPPVQLSVGVQAAEPVTYEWRRNGIVLSAGGNVSILSDESGSLLQISNPVGDQFASYEVTVTDGCGRSTISSEADLFLGHRRITGYAIGSPRRGLTTGGTTITLRGDGLESGMIVGFRSPLFEALADPLDVNEVLGSNGTLLEVTVPPFPPGCDCADGVPLVSRIVLDDDCGADPVDSGVIFRFDIVQVVVTDRNGVQAEIDASSGVPGRCIILPYLGSGPPEVTTYPGSLILDSTHSALTLTAEYGTSLGQVLVVSGSPFVTTVTIAGSGPGVCVDGLAIVGGNGGMEIRDGASPIVHDCQFDDNFADSNHGGALTVRNGTAAPCMTHPLILGCTISQNSTTGNGGALRVEHASVTVLDCLIAGNDAIGRGGALYLEDNCPDLLVAETRIVDHPDSDGEPVQAGGGIYWTAGPAPQQTLPLRGTVLRNHILRNKAEGKGAGIFLDRNLTPVVVGNFIQDNEGTTDQSKGGGIFLENNFPAALGVVEICENVLSGNKAQLGAAIVVLPKQTPRIERNLIHCNTAVQRGEEGPMGEDPPDSYAGGIFVEDAGPDINHNSIFGNRGADGIAPYSQSGGIHAASLAFGTESFERNILMQNEGWEFFSGVELDQDELPVNDNIAYDPADPAVPIYAQGSPFGVLNDYVDPLFLAPECDPSDPWAAFDVDDLSLPAADDTFRGAIPTHPFELGACVPPVPGDCNENGIPDRIELLAGTGSDSNGNGLLDECEASFFADVEALPAATGGELDFFLNPGVAYARDRFLILGSMSGTSPGMDFRSVHLPLNPDAYFLETQQGSASAAYLSYSGVLDEQGQATAHFALPPVPSLIGMELHHAFLVLHERASGGPKTWSGGVVFASNAVRLRLE